MDTYTLNDEWWIPRALDLVEKECEAHGYHFVQHDFCGCNGKSASCYIEKDGYYKEILFEELYHAYSHGTLLRWLRRLAS